MLESLRSKPDYVKKIISFSLSSVIFLMIMFVWFTSYDARAHSEESREKALTPLSGFSAMFDNKVSEVKENYSANLMYTTSPTEEKEADVVVPILPASVPQGFDTSAVVVVDSSPLQATSTNSVQFAPTQTQTPVVSFTEPANNQTYFNTATSGMRILPDL